MFLSTGNLLCSWNITSIQSILLYFINCTSKVFLQLFQGGGAPTQTALSAAMTSIQEGLKDNDWSTRKAASAALGEIASGGGSFRGPFKSSCIRCLESCRFDKVSSKF